MTRFLRILRRSLIGGAAAPLTLEGGDVRRIRMKLDRLSCGWEGDK